jgi:type VI secretion system protein
VLRKRLLERVLEDGTAAGRMRAADPDAVLTSIIESLRRILNSGWGDASTDGRYGLPDLRGLVRNMPQSADGMKEAIKEAVERYEPRLKRVRVRRIDDPDSHRVHFEIVAELNDEDDAETRPLKFNTRLERSGRLEISA